MIAWIIGRFGEDVSKDAKGPFAMRSRRRRESMRFLNLEALEGRELLAAPVLDAIRGVSVPAGQISVPVGKSLLVPLTAFDADGDALTYSVTSDGTDVSATILRAGTYLKITVAGKGDMVFQLFPEFAPNTVAKISGLVNAGFYNGLTFHRIVPNFVIQGGDPKGDGTGGPGFTFNDEFDPRAIFSGDGQLAMANSGANTNGSQLFVTIGTQRSLDNKHTIWGQLLRGFDVVQNIVDDPRNTTTNRPLTPIVITSASFITNTSDAVLLLQSNTSGYQDVTVTVDDGTAGGKVSTSFRAGDVMNKPPKLDPVANQITATNAPITFTLSATDLEHDASFFAVDNADSPVRSTILVTGNTVKITPASGYKGDIHLVAKVRQANTPNGAFSTQAFTITVKDQSLTSEGVNSVGNAGGPVQPLIARMTAEVPLSAANYTATIDWGDGSKSAGTVTGSNGVFEIRGAKTYFRFGTYPVTVKITETATKLSTTATSQAVIADAPLNAVFVAPTPSLTSGLVSGQVAAFANANVGARMSDLSAIIEWGDGTMSAGTITGGNGIYAVSGTKTYLSLGTFNVKVKVSNVGGSTAEALGTLTIANHAPLLSEIGAQSIVAGKTLALAFAASDSDAGQTVTFSLAPGAPSGATIDPATGIFRWTPTSGPSIALITVLATDSGSPAMTSSRPFSVNVAANPPLVTVASAKLTKKKNAVAAIQLAFSGDVDPSSTGPFADIALLSAGKDRKFGTRDDVATRFRSTKYDPASRTMTLSPRTPLGPSGTFRIRLNGVADRLGRAIDSDGDGVAGGSFVTIAAKSGILIRANGKKS